MTPLAAIIRAKRDTSVGGDATNKILDYYDEYKTYDKIRMI